MNTKAITIKFIRKVTIKCKGKQRIFEAGSMLTGIPTAKHHDLKYGSVEAFDLVAGDVTIENIPYGMVEIIW